MSEDAPQPVLALTRIVDSAVIGLVFLAGIQLYILSEETHRYFAWTIGVPLTAAFLGAGYWGALVSTLHVLRAGNWVQGRSTMATAFTATTLLLVATFLHLDKFHLDSSVFITLLAAWVWVIVYVAVPPTLVLTYLAQARVPGTNPARRKDLPAWLRVTLAAQCVLASASGIALFVIPGETMEYWPWALTPLTARAIGSWIAAVGATAAAVLWENDRSRVAATLTGLATFASLELIALLRFEGSVEWSDAASWIYVAFLVSLLVVSAAGLWPSAARSRTASTGPTEAPDARVGVSP
ncbi:MAG TPA: hypothetical protein VI876_02350 [Dehalococcoidia bacterium]|nr:hypothetical protein [Dehalococcoidia bacterium]